MKLKSVHWERKWSGEHQISLLDRWSQNINLWTHTINHPPAWLVQSDIFILLTETVCCPSMKRDCFLRMCRKLCHRFGGNLCNGCSRCSACVKCLLWSCVRKTKSLIVWMAMKMSLCGSGWSTLMKWLQVFVVATPSLSIWVFSLVDCPS